MAQIEEEVQVDQVEEGAEAEADKCQLVLGCTLHQMGITTSMEVLF